MRDKNVCLANTRPGYQPVLFTLALSDVKSLSRLLQILNVKRIYSDQTVVIFMLISLGLHKRAQLRQMILSCT